MRAALAGASLCLSLVVAAHTEVPAQRPQTFAAGTAAVVVDVMVTRDGTPVTGLTVADFEVRDAGTQQIQFIGVEQVPVALLLALDTSASVRGPALDQLKEAAKAAVASLRPVDQAALMTFSQHVALPSGWTNDKGRLQAAIDKATAQGSTSLTDASFAALLMRPASAARTLVLLFTDGEDSSSWLDAAAVVDASRRTDSVVYAVTLSAPATSAAAAGPERAKPFLASLAQETGGESFIRAETRDLRAAFVEVLARFNQRYVLLYSSPHPPGSGWHPLEVRVKGRGLTVNARRGYTR